MPLASRLVGATIRSRRQIHGLLAERPMRGFRGSVRDGALALVHHSSRRVHRQAGRLPGSARREHGRRRSSRHDHDRCSHSVDPIGPPVGVPPGGRSGGSWCFPRGEVTRARRRSTRLDGDLRSTAQTTRIHAYSTLTSSNEHRLPIGPSWGDRQRAAGEVRRVVSNGVEMARYRDSPAGLGGADHSCRLSVWQPHAVGAELRRHARQRDQRDPAADEADADATLRNGRSVQVPGSDTTFVSGELHLGSDDPPRQGRRRDLGDR